MIDSGQQVGNAARAHRNRTAFACSVQRRCERLVHRHAGTGRCCSPWAIPFKSLIVFAGTSVIRDQNDASVEGLPRLWTLEHWRHDSAAALSATFVC